MHGCMSGAGLLGIQWYNLPLLGQFSSHVTFVWTQSHQGFIINFLPIVGGAQQVGKRNLEAVAFVNTQHQWARPLV